MEICNSILHNTGVAIDEDFIELSYDERFLRRKNYCLIMVLNFL